MTIDYQSWQEKIQQLGSKEDRELLQRLRKDDPELADVMMANTIQNHLDDIGLQGVSNDLQQKLYAITDDRANSQKPRKNSLQRWAAWASVAAVVVIAVALKPWQSSQQPSALEVAEARQQLAIAFHYLNRSADRTRHYTETSIAQGVQTAMDSASFLAETEQLIDL